MSSDHRAQAPLTNPIDELADESDFESIVFYDVDGIVCYGSRPLLSGEPSDIPTKGQWRGLEILVKKGTELKNVHWGHSLKAYPVLSIGKNGKSFYVSKKPKPVNLDGGSNPMWNTYEEFKLDIDEVRQKKPDLIFRVNSKSKLPSHPSRLVGEASVAIEDLLNDFGDAVDWKSVILGVKNKKGEQNGSITFKYKFGRTLKPKSADPLSSFAADPLSQSANGNPMDQMRKNDSHSIVKGAVAKGAAGGTASGIFETLGELVLDNL